MPEVTFVDVAPRSIGLRAVGDRFAPLIARSTSLPASASRVFATTKADQRSFELQVLQGEDGVASKNRRLADVIVEPISAGPAGEVKLRVTFTVDEHGRLSVSASEVGAATETRVEIQPASGLGRGEVQRLAAERRRQKDAATAAATDPSVLEPALPTVEFGSAPVPAPAPAPAPAPRPSLASRPAPNAAAASAPVRGVGLRVAVALAVLAALAVLGYLLAT